MAIILEEYQRRVDKVRLHLVELWCLCKYCKLYDPQHHNFEDWAEELLYAMKDIKSLNIKSGNKFEILNQMLIANYDFDNANTVYRIVTDRFHRECVFDSFQIRNVCAAFAEKAEGFVNALGDDSIIAYKYICDTFNLQD